MTFKELIEDMVAGQSQEYMMYEQNGNINEEIKNIKRNQERNCG